MIHSTTNRLPRGSGRTACGVMNLPGLTNSRLLGKPYKAQTSSLTPSAQIRRSSWSRTDDQQPVDERKRSRWDGITHRDHGASRGPGQLQSRVANYELVEV